MQFVVARALLKNSVSIEEWLAATTFVKNCTLKKLFPAIIYKEKMLFRNNYSSLDHSLFLWVFTYYFTKFFVHLWVSGAVCYFWVYKLIGVGPSKHLLVQSQQQDTRNRSELCPKLTIKRVESRSVVVTVNFE